MLFTKEIDYAVRIIRDLSSGGRKTIDDICRNELIPRQFSYKILKKLEKAGMVQIFRGAGGGYSLAKDVRDITLLSVITSINSEPLLNECLGRDYECPLHGKDGKVCGIRNELERIQNHIYAFLREKTLAELV